MTELNFKGKDFVHNHHLSVPFHPLEPQPDKGIGEVALDGSLIIEGDNLKALKSLIPTHAGRVNCVYIDPPYNTGNEKWCYNDKVNSPMIKEWFSENPVDSDDGLRHDKWCAMMWPRLRLLHELLAEDGVIFVSIDDNEHHHLRMLMDDIFGTENFVGSFVWEGTGKNDARFISVGHDYVVTYAKRFEEIKTNTKRWRVLKEGIDDVQKCVDALKREHGEDYNAISEGLLKNGMGLYNGIIKHGNTDTTVGLMKTAFISREIFLGRVAGVLSTRCCTRLR